MGLELINWTDLGERRTGTEEKDRKCRRTTRSQACWVRVFVDRGMGGPSWMIYTFYPIHMQRIYSATSRIYPFEVQLGVDKGCFTFGYFPENPKHQQQQP
jgi:hypothetical protein